MLKRIFGSNTAACSDDGIYFNYLSDVSLRHTSPYARRFPTGLGWDYDLSSQRPKIDFNGSQLFFLYVFPQKQPTHADGAVHLTQANSLPMVGCKKLSCDYFCGFKTFNGDFHAVIMDLHGLS
jgi:hypothetical protein